MLILAIKPTNCFKSHKEEHDIAISMRDDIVASIYPDIAPEYTVSEHGKPLEANGLFAYSVSHTAGCIVCALSAHASPPSNAKPLPHRITTAGLYLLSHDTYFSVGCDAENIRNVTLPRLRRISDRFFSDGERALISESHDPVAEFCRIWTRKESLVKCTGDGLSKLGKADTTLTDPELRFEISAKLDETTYICTVTVSV